MPFLKINEIIKKFKRERFTFGGKQHKTELQWPKQMMGLIYVRQ